MIPAPRRREALVVLVATAAAWAALVALVDPRGEFPMMDDWIYQRVVAIWTAEGRLALPEVTQMVALGHIALGVAVSRVAGPSFEMLRLTTLAIGWLGIVAVYAAARAFGATIGVAGLAAATLLVNPIYVTMSATFMTDIPFFVVSALALVAYARGLHDPRWATVIAATALSAVAATIRQPALILPAAFLVALPLRHGFSRRTILMAGAPLVVVAAELVALPMALDAAGLLPRDYNLPMREMRRNLAAPSLEWAAFAAKRALNIGFHLGWFLLPFALVAGVWTRRRLTAAAALGGVIVAAVLVTGKVAPWGSSLLYDFGIGGVSLHDVGVLGLPHLPRAPWAFWFGLTALSAIAVAVLTVEWSVTIAGAWRARRAEAMAACAFSLLAAAGYTVPLMLSWFYDRYLLPVVPCLMVYAAVERGVVLTRRRAAAAVVVMLPLAGFAAGSAHDYFAWNRARWDAVAFLLERADPQQGVQQIDGGYEFAGLGRYTDGAAWQQPADPQFMVTFGAVPGYREIARFDYVGWLPPRRAAILALERERPLTVSLRTAAPTLPSDRQSR